MVKCCDILVASEVEHFERTQLVAAAWMADSLADSHWQARSVRLQVVADWIAALMQG
jgi:hypothetical protein